MLFVNILRDETRKVETLKYEGEEESDQILDFVGENCGEKDVVEGIYTEAGDDVTDAIYSNLDLDPEFED